MSYIEFEKTQLVNLEYSLDKELIRSNRSGSFSCTTIIGCNTRKYHGLLICPQPELDYQNHVLFSKVDETIIQHDEEFNIGINKYPFTYSPKGHKYIEDFSADVIPIITFRVGGVILTKEFMFAIEEESILIKYTLVQAESPTRLRLMPFLAFRPVHLLSKKNLFIETKYQPVPGGIKIKPYQGYSDLHIQLSCHNSEYVHVPDWYEKIEYIKEHQRGYEYQEDLFVPGFFEFEIKKNEPVIFCASTKQLDAKELPCIFDKELKQRIPRNSFENCLNNSAEQFFYRTPETTGIVAGYPWHDRIGRYTFLSLPGLSLSTNNFSTCKEVLDSMISEMKGTFFPETGYGENIVYGTADTSLWFIWALQLYTYKTSYHNNVWDEYGNVISSILDGLSKNNQYDIYLEDNGLLYCHNQTKALTWMNSMVDSKPVVQRFGYVIEVNALWYNAIMFAIEMARKAKDKKFISKWEPVAKKIPEAFKDIFWNNETKSMFDCVNYINSGNNISVRPNQIIATSLPFSPVDEITCLQIINKCKNELLTPRGLRTLSPKNHNYIGTYNGDENKREKASFQGTVYPWLLGHFAEGYLKIYQKEGVDFIKQLHAGFEEAVREAGIGTVSEMYDGDPPHKPCGAISFAPSVAEILRINDIIDKYNKG